jgi:GNAT superfamily N-acetyltransferase
MEIVSTTSFAVQIRAAMPEDLECIVEYNMRLAIESENKILDRGTLRQGVLALLKDPTKGRYFVAVHEGEVIGQLMHTREWSDWRNGDIWWLQSVYIAAPFRRKGVFRRLYQHLWDEAQSSSDVVGVRLYVEVENFAAHETYRNMGLIQPGYFVMENLSKSQAVRRVGKKD